MSAIGTKRTYACALHMSAFGGKADTAKLRFKPGSCEVQKSQLECGAYFGWLLS